jgi:hypothetical protein
MIQIMAEINAVLKANEERMMAILKVGLEEMKSVAEHQEVPKEEAPDKSSGTMKKRHRGRNLAAGRRGEPKERTRENLGSRKELAAARRRTTRHAGVGVTRCKGHFFRKNEARDKVTRKGRTLGRRQLTRQEGMNGTRNRDFKKQRCLRRSESLSGRMIGKTIGLEIEKRITRSPVWIRKMTDLILLRGRHLPKRKKSQAE